MVFSSGHISFPENVHPIPLKQGGEDCLYLYVYTTSTPGALDNKPVLLWIHGGGLETGDGYLGSKAFGGTYVSVNNVRDMSLSTSQTSPPRHEQDGSRLAEEFGVVVHQIDQIVGVPRQATAT